MADDNERAVAAASERIPASCAQAPAAKWTVVLEREGQTERRVEIKLLARKIVVWGKDVDDIYRVTKVDVETGVVHAVFETSKRVGG